RTWAPAAAALPLSRVAAVRGTGCRPLLRARGRRARAAAAAAPGAPAGRDRAVGQWQVVAVVWRGGTGTPGRHQVPSGGVGGAGVGEGGGGGGGAGAGGVADGCAWRPAERRPGGRGSGGRSVAGGRAVWQSAAAGRRPVRGVVHLSGDAPSAQRRRGYRSTRG